MTRGVSPAARSGTCYFLFSILTLLCPSLVFAHLLNMSQVQVDVQPDGQVDVQLELDLTVALGGSAEFHSASQTPDSLAEPALQALADTVTGAVHLMAGDVRIDLAVVRLRMPDDGLDVFLSGLVWPRAHLELQGHMPTGEGGLPAPVRVVFEAAFPFEEPIAVTLRDVAGGITVSRWLVAEQRSPQLVFAGAPSGANVETASQSGPDAAESLAVLLKRYLWFGFDHILPGGLDHLLFVAGLFLGSRRIRELIGLISTYTLAHTLTLGLAALSWVEVSAIVVEPLIAVSIAWIAVENLRPNPSVWWRAGVVLLFGLIHGLGFAGAIREAGLPAEGTLWALAAFNVGVELGQLTWILLLLALFGIWRQRPGYQGWVVRPLSVLIGLVAVVWTIERLIA